MMRPLLACSLLASLALAGCHSATKPAEQPSPTQASANPGYKVYKLRGKVISTDASSGEVTLDHEAIPGFMDAMVMPYKLKDPSLLSTLHPGDIITADVLVSGEDEENILLDHIIVVAQGKHP